MCEVDATTQSGNYCTRQKVFTCGPPGNSWPSNHIVELTKTFALVNPILLVISWP